MDILVILLLMCVTSIGILMSRYEYLQGYKRGYSKGFRKNLIETVKRLRREGKL